MQSARALRTKGDTTAARAKRRSCLRGMRALGRLLRDGLHGQVTVKTKNGTATIAFERGVIQSVNGSSVVIKSPDGTTWTWTLTSKTTIHKARRKVAASALAQGEKVIVAGPTSGGTYTARHIGIRK